MEVLVPALAGTPGCLEYLLSPGISGESCRPTCRFTSWREPQKLRAGGHQGFPRTIDMDDPNGEMALALKAPPGLYTQYGQNGNSSTTGCQI